MNNSVTAHMIVKNEDQFIWYAISSVLPYVDKFIIFDTGSTDKTVEIIRLFKDKKIVFKQKEKVDALGLAALRNEQIHFTKGGWIWIADGDEAYPQKTVKNILGIINGKKDYLGIIVHRYDLLGDIYHYQDEGVGAYNQFGKKGHYVLRLINKNKIPGLQVKGEYPNEYYANRNGQSIKMLGKDEFAFVEERIFHAMYLPRSSSETDFSITLNRKKRKIESGKPISHYELPEIFFQKRPSFVDDVTKKINLRYKLLANAITPIKQLKRKIFEKL